MPSKNEAIAFDPVQPPRILIDMEVARIQRFPAEKAVQIWGYVGDYEVAVNLPSNDARVRSLLRLNKLAKQLESEAAE